MAEDIENFKNQLIKYLHENCPNIDIKFSDETEIGNAFLLDIKEIAREKTAFYEVSITKHIGSNEYEIAKADQQQLEKALITNDEKEFIKDYSIETFTINHNYNGYYFNKKVNYISCKFRFFKK